MLILSLPLDETTNIVIEKLFFENETIYNLNKDKFKCLLALATKEPYFLFDGELYQQVGSAAMCSPLGLALANTFLYHYENIWQWDCSLECKPSYYKRYVFHIFVLLESETQVGSFKHFMKTCRLKMKFTFVKEHSKYFNFLDVEFIRQNKVFTTSVYRKSTFSGVYTHFDSYMLLSYKFSLVSTIIFRIFTIYSDMPRSHQEICRIKDIFIKNSYTEKFIDKCVKTFLNEVCIPKRVIQLLERNKLRLFYLIWESSRLSLKSKYIKHLKNYYQHVI